MDHSLPQLKLEGHTPNPEAFMAYVARVSNPGNQHSDNYARLLSYCIRNRHWSVFEHASMTLAVTTTLDIATQILRHRSFCFQQLSRRYAGSETVPMRWQLPELRAPDPKNRQGSQPTLPPELADRWQERLARHMAISKQLYEEMLADGIAKECARAVLPQATHTTLYMTGNCRSWMHYITLRLGNGTQPEHQAVAVGARTIFQQVFPACAAALDTMAWTL